MFRKTNWIVSIVTLSLAVTYAWGQAAKETPADIEATITKGLKAYKDGKSGDAIAALQQAISMIQRSQQKGMAAFFPKAPEGWEAGKLESQSGASADASQTNFNMTTISQNFTRKSDSATANVSLVNSPSLVETQKGMMEVYKNPQMLEAMNKDPKTKVTMIDQDGWTGMRTVHKDSSVAIQVFHGPYMLSVQVNKDDEKAMDSFWKGINLKGLAATAPQATSKPAK